MQTTPSLKIDFGKNISGQNWQIVNDGVMGGLSRGQVEMTEETLIFSGTVSLENNGGFTSLRGPYEQYDLSNFETIKVRYRSKIQHIAFRMELYERWFMPYFKKDLPETNNEWKTISFSLAEFSEYRIGDATGNKMSPKNLANVIRLGFITNSKKASEFEFEVDYILFE